LANLIVYQLPFEQHPLPTPFDDTSRLIFSLATPPSTNCYHLRLWFKLLFRHMACYKCRVLIHLLTYFSERGSCDRWN